MYVFMLHLQDEELRQLQVSAVFIKNIETNFLFVLLVKLIQENNL